MIQFSKEDRIHMMAMHIMANTNFGLVTSSEAYDNAARNAYQRAEKATAALDSIRIGRTMTFSKP